MGSRGVAVVVGAALVLASCGGELRLGTAPTTITTTTTTTLVRPRVTKSAALRKAKPPSPAPVRTTTSTVPRPDNWQVAATPDEIERLLIQPDESWVQLDDDAIGTGPIDLDKAVADNSDGGGDLDEVQEFFETNGFEAGYSRVWAAGAVIDENGEPNTDNANVLFVAVYKFGSAEAAAALRDWNVETMEGERHIGAVEPFAVDGIPGARGYAGGNKDDGYTAVVVFAKGSYSVQLAYTMPHHFPSTYEHLAGEYARRQYRQLPR